MTNYDGVVRQVDPRIIHALSPKAGPVSEELRYSERDVVLAKREGWEDCAKWFNELHSRGGHLPMSTYRIEASAIEMYPMPSVVVRDSEGCSWRMNAGGIEYQFHQGGNWYSLPSSLPKVASSVAIPGLTVERLDLLTKLRSEAGP